MIKMIKWFLTIGPDFLLKDVHVLAELRDRVPGQVEPESQLAHLVRDEARDRLHLHDVRVCGSDLTTFKVKF